MVERTGGKCQNVECHLALWFEHISNQHLSVAMVFFFLLMIQFVMVSGKDLRKDLTCSEGHLFFSGYRQELAIQVVLGGETRPKLFHFDTGCSITYVVHFIYC